VTPELKLKQLLDEYGRGAKAKLAKFLNISPVYVTRWVTDDKYNIPRDTIPKLENFFNKNAGFFLGNDDKKPVAKIKVVGTASCGAPDGNHFFDDGNGDSMSPEIEDGDEIVCDPDVEPQNGDIVH